MTVKMSFLLAMLCGSIFFPLMLLLTKTLIQIVLKTHKDSFNVSVKLVSALQGTMSCTIGYIIASSCPDILRDQHYLTDVYAMFGFPYFYYDIVAMYYGHLLNYTDLAGSSHTRKLFHFFMRNRFLCFHHIIMPIFLLPIILVFRRGIGDYFIGVLYVMELPIPCLSLYGILIQLKKQDSILFPITGIAMTTLFGIGRIGVFIFLYVSYSRYANIPLSSVPWVIPRHCNIGTLALVAPQLYWFCYMNSKIFKFVTTGKRKL